MMILKVKKKIKRKKILWKGGVKLLPFSCLVQEENAILSFKMGLILHRKKIKLQTK